MYVPVYSYFRIFKVYCEIDTLCVASLQINSTASPLIRAENFRLFLSKNRKLLWFQLLKCEEQLFFSV